MAVLTAAMPGNGSSGDFARLSSNAVGVACGRWPRATVSHPRRIAGVIDAEPSRPGWQTVSQGLLGGQDRPAAVLPQPPVQRPVARPGPAHPAPDRQQELRVSDLREHFLPRARGVRRPGRIRLAVRRPGGGATGPGGLAERSAGSQRAGRDRGPADRASPPSSAAWWCSATPTGGGRVPPDELCAGHNPARRQHRHRDSRARPDNRPGSRGHIRGRGASARIRRPTCSGRCADEA